jgi:hypothetical protein
MIIDARLSSFPVHTFITTPKRARFVKVSHRERLEQIVDVFRGLRDLEPELSLHEYMAGQGFTYSDYKIASTILEQVTSARDERRW